jgi:hypothetical protein
VAFEERGFADVIPWYEDGNKNIVADLLDYLSITNRSLVMFGDSMNTQFKSNIRNPSRFVLRGVKQCEYSCYGVISGIWPQKYRRNEERYIWISVVVHPRRIRKFWTSQES